MVWGFIAGKVLWDLLGPAKKKSTETSSTSSVSSSSSLYDDVHARWAQDDLKRQADESSAELHKWLDKPAHEPVKIEPVQRKVFLSYNQKQKVAKALDNAALESEDRVKLAFARLVFGDDESNPLFVQEIEEAIQILQESEGDAQQIELLQAAIPRLTNLWLQSRERRRQHDSDIKTLGRWQLYEVYTEEGSDSARAFIENIPSELHEAAMRVLEFYELIYSN